VSSLTVAFDGPNPKLSSTDKKNYQNKIEGFQNWLSARPTFTVPVSVWVNDEWTHQAVMLKRVYNDITASDKMTPFLFFAQDDSEVVGDVDTHKILQALNNDPQVQYVRFYWQQDCRYDVFLSTRMCNPEVTRDDLIQTPWYSDRPHFATASFYADNVFPKIPENARNNPEVLVERKLVSLKTMWMYGTPGNMFHDVNHMSWSHNMENKRIENVRAREWMRNNEPHETVPQVEKKFKAEKKLNSSRRRRRSSTRAVNIM
jgi:hypothetical protein